MCRGVSSGVFHGYTYTLLLTPLHPPKSYRYDFILLGKEEWGGHWIKMSMSGPWLSPVAANQTTVLLWYLWMSPPTSIHHKKWINTGCGVKGCDRHWRKQQYRSSSGRYHISSVRTPRSGVNNPTALWAVIGIFILHIYCFFFSIYVLYCS